MRDLAENPFLSPVMDKMQFIYDWLINIAVKLPVGEHEGMVYHETVGEKKIKFGYDKLIKTHDECEFFNIYAFYDEETCEK